MNTNTLGPCWIAFYPTLTGYPSIGTFCCELGAPDADAESAGLVLAAALPEGGELLQEHLVKLGSLPDVVIVQAHTGLLAGAVLGAAIGAARVVYVVGEGAPELAAHLGAQGFGEVLVAASAADAAEQALARKW